jgi:hypothetical protein
VGPGRRAHRALRDAWTSRSTRRAARGGRCRCCVVRARRRRPARRREALRDRISSAGLGLLGCSAVDADPLQSREHILLSNDLDHAWREGRASTSPALIQRRPEAAVRRASACFDLETFFPAKERFALAMALNNLLASPGFAAWMEGRAARRPAPAVHARTASRASASSRSRT